MSGFEYQNVTTTEVPTKTNVNELIYLIAPIVIIVVIILFSALVSNSLRLLFYFKIIFPHYT